MLGECLISLCLLWSSENVGDIAYISRDRRLTSMKKAISIWSQYWTEVSELMIVGVKSAQPERLTAYPPVCRKTDVVYW